MQNRPKTPLSIHDEADNAAIIDGLFAEFPRTEKAKAVKTSLEQFVQQNGITLGNKNLLEDEEEHLRDILLKALSEKEFNLKLELNKWMVSLKHAVSGRGAHIDLYRGNSSGMASDLINTGAVNLTTLGTDLDAHHSLGDLLNNPELLKKGCYVLPPVSLTQVVGAAAPTVALQNALQNMFDLLKEQGIQKDIYVCAPVNCGDSHWRLARFMVNVKDGNPNILRAGLWDSLGGNPEDVKSTPAFQNFTQVVQSFSAKVEPELELAAVQKNGYSCLDYVVNHIYHDVDPANEIDKVKNAQELRLAMVKQIARNHPHIDNELVDNIQVQGDQIVIGDAVQQDFLPLTPDEEKTGEALLVKFDSAEQSKRLTPEEINWQITFDAVFSEHLQELYDAHPAKHVNEGDLVAEARRRAMREIGFFPAARKPARVIDETIIHKPTFVK